MKKHRQHYGDYCILLRSMTLNVVLTRVASRTHFVEGFHICRLSKLQYKHGGEYYFICLLLPTLDIFQYCVMVSEVCVKSL